MNAADPNRFNTGLIAYGNVTLNGANTTVANTNTTWTYATGDIAKDATEVTLQGNLSTWANQNIALPDTRLTNGRSQQTDGVNTTDQWEEITLGDVASTTATTTTFSLTTLATLTTPAATKPTFTHLGLTSTTPGTTASILPPVGLLTRNVVLRSQMVSFDVLAGAKIDQRYDDTGKDNWLYEPIRLPVAPATTLGPRAVALIQGVDSHQQRGHTLFGGRAVVDIEGVEFKDLGRTDAMESIFAGAPDVNTAGPYLANQNNRVGRYAVHLHHLIGSTSGLIDPNNPAGPHVQYIFNNDSIVGSTKWALALHDTSYGEVQGNVIWKAQGAGIMTEDGSEIENKIYNNFVAVIQGAWNPLQNKSGQAPGECRWRIRPES
jgi:hypothetical protein